MRNVSIKFVQNVNIKNIKEIEKKEKEHTNEFRA